MRVRITSEQLRAFEMLSHARYPLHNDRVYSRSTQFGRPIVYGMCAVLLGLAQWATGRAFRLTRIQGKFVKPLFESVEYELGISEEGNQVRVEYCEGGITQVRFGFAWVENQPNAGRIVPLQGLSQFQPLALAKDPDLATAIANWQGVDYSYSVRLEKLSQLLPTLGLNAAQIPSNQLNALMGSSYLVGMEIPGRQALYSSFEFDFDPASSDGNPNDFQFNNVSAALDARFNRVQVSGKGRGIRAFSLLCFQRPKRVRYGIEEIHRAISHSESLKNSVVFISGAVRGFGSVLAKMCALQDANVLLNYRSAPEEAQAIVDEIRPWNTKVFPFAGDVSNFDDCRRIRTEVEKRFERIDFLISNAFPQIPARGFWEQSIGEFLQFVQESVSTSVNLLHELLPLVPAGGTVVLISSCYTRIPIPQFSHYIASKSCLEGLMRSLASEFPDRKFVIFRSPRMLTDQTNLAYDLSPPSSAIAVGRKLMEVLRKFPAASNLAEIDPG